MDATAVRSLLLRFALVVAVLAGLLAMHTLVAGQPHTAAAAVVTVEHHPAEASGETGAPLDAEECGPECLPLHAMGLMACVLALLAGLVLLAATRAGSWRPRRSPATASFVTALRSIVPQPPSLVALSISRT
jgi:hypothetical protein